MKHLREISGAAQPVDYAALVFECTQGLPPVERTKARTTLIERLRELSDKPSPEMSPDDHADALHRLADALVVVGDRAGAQAANERRLVVLEQAAARAPSPEAAATYDYGRASAYLALGRGDDAVRMLQEREKQLPSSYEPPGRLASILAELKRWPEAQAAVERALEHAYGPRRLRYLALKARIHEARGDRQAAVNTLDEELRGHRALGRQAADAAVKDVQKRLDEARKKLR
jgi:tetratricopeptide (TPR) repeat protein